MGPPPASWWCSAASPWPGSCPQPARAGGALPTPLWAPGTRALRAVNCWHQPVKGSTRPVSPAPAAAPAHPWEPLMREIFRVSCDFQGALQQSLRNGHSPESACKWGLGATRHLFWAPVETQSPGFLQLCNI